MSTGAIIVLVAVVLLVLAVVGWFVSAQLRRRRLQDRFGPEYDRRVSETDNRRDAERELAELQKRHSTLDLRPLSEGSRQRYAEQWVLIQEQFVDRPGEAVVEAEQLVHSVMRERGYPTDSFDQQAADLSVEHATAVDHYRSAHEIQDRHQSVGASTEDLRKALVHYRMIFVDVAGFAVDGQRTDQDGGGVVREQVDQDRTDQDRTDQAVARQHTGDQGGVDHRPVDAESPYRDPAGQGDPRDPRDSHSRNGQPETRETPRSTQPHS